MKTYAKFQQKKINSMEANTRQSFQFFKQNILKTIELCLSLWMGFCIT